MDNLKFTDLTDQEIKDVNGGGALLIGGLILLGLILSTEKAS
ncbi:MAG: class IIb bacteriocin, lactobin A/cerein 7B family [Bacteroidales bacterium]